VAAWTDIREYKYWAAFVAYALILGQWSDLKWDLVFVSLAQNQGAVAGLVGIECGVVSGVINLESSGVEASDWRPRHDEHYHEA
jgi:hypothetical protein